MSIIWERIKQKESFCFVRINDGEASAILSDTVFVSRGDEQSSKLLSIKLTNIIDDNYTYDNLYIGIPCMSCYHECYNIIKDRLCRSKNETFMEKNVMDANILINSNYDRTLDVLSNYLNDRRIVVVSNEIIVSNIHKLQRLNINVCNTYTVSSTMAFSKDYDNVKDLTFPDGSFIITLCGPLGRVLCYEWFLQNQTLSCLDLGSFFDPLLRNKSYLYHTNNHRYCPNCYPTADNRYTNIFNYCDTYVDKECYYLNTLNDNVRLYNNDWNRIILNTIIRLEKHPGSFPSNLLTYAYAQKFAHDNNYLFTDDINIFSTLVSICKKYKPIRILSFGFDSAIFVFLENCGCIVHVIDSKKEITPEKYKDRITIYKNFASISNSFVYDLVYIDNGNYFDIVNYISKSSYVSYKDTLLVVNGYIKNKSFIKSYDITKACEICKSKDIILPILEEDYDFNAGIGIYSYIRFNVVVEDIVVNNYRLITGLYESSDENDKKKIDTYMEISNLLKGIEYIHEGYTFQNFELFEDLTNFCHAKNPQNILEIGFLCGSSALMFLINTTGKLTSIDINECPYSEHYIQSKWPNRFTFLNGNSNEIIGNLVDKFSGSSLINDDNILYDLIFIDGSHDYETVKQDTLNSIKLLHMNGYIIINDVVLTEEFRNFWNEGATQVYQELCKMPEYTIEEQYAKSYCKGRGIVIFQVKRNFSIHTMSKTAMKEELYRYINSCNNCNDCNVLIDSYLNYFSILLSFDEICLLKSFRSDINELECMLTSKSIINNNIRNRINSKLVKYYDEKNNTNAVIPKIIHLIYINERPLQLYNYQCIYSIIRHHSDYQIWIHNDIEPDTQEWSNLCNVQNVYIKRINRNKLFDGIDIQFVQYEADILRMSILLEYGGIYMDIDVYVIKNISPLLTGHGLYIVKETEESLINCVIISEIGNKFLEIWFNYFKTGLRIDVWAWHIRELPKMLLSDTYQLSKYNIKLLGYETFCPIHWTEKNKITDSTTCQLSDNVYGIHLFETILGNELQDSYILNL